MQQPQIEKTSPQLDIKQTTSISCDNCKSQAFQEAVILRSVSAILSPSGKSGVLPVPCFACISCGHINSQFLPPELRENKIINTSSIIT